MRHTKAKDKLSRKYGELLSGMPMFEINKRPYPPGQHGLKRTKNSEYGSLLQEKQKLKYSYGVQENQFRRYFQKATKIKGPTGEILIQLLETRLDNLVYRFGFAPTLAAARQLVTHGHVLVNNKKVDIPSYAIKPGTEIILKESARKLEPVKNAIKNTPQVLDYLSVQKELFVGKLVEMPQRSQIPININERLIVEFYSR
ncbi:MAG: 30S ribosomal protein S4 [Candidatus Melainabacteria bacterium RIFCSPHIGHO2_02_FULL_34_12]|nr:MAG: 30S ribosomal protein S4 [Candidatus Melainabacteria bacterium RIFCSPHIGHO2_02_FULL_34_12]